MTKIFYGCDEVTKGWPRYFDLANAIEIPDRGKTPAIKTLNTWRVKSPKGFGFIVHFSNEFVGHLDRLSSASKTEFDEAALLAFEQTMEKARALGATALLLPTSFEFGPTETNRKLLARLATLDRGKMMLVWEFQGMWTTENAMEFAKGVGMIPAFDPFMAHEEGLSFGHGDGCFKLSERQGSRRYFDGYDFEQVLDWGAHFDRLLVLARGRFKWRHLRELRETMKSAD